MIKWSIHIYSDITFVNLYAPNIGMKYIKQILTDLNVEIDSNTITGTFNTSLLMMATSPRQKINKEIGLQLHVRLDGFNRHL